MIVQNNLSDESPALETLRQHRPEHKKLLRHLLQVHPLKNIV
jgi:hypothetical protein